LKYKSSFVKALLKEFEIKSPLLKDINITSIYFGGGTPSVLNKDQLDEIFTALRKEFLIDLEAEITFELNPEDATTDYLLNLKETGINRLSIGCQTFSNDLLKSINRNHTGEESISAVKNAQSTGFKKISLDLIYGIVGSTTTSFTEDLNTLMELAPDHISAYALTIEPETVFGKRKSKKQFKEISDEDYIDQYELMLRTLKSNGYEQYEISNFSKDQSYSKHNTAYWFNQTYFGFGPGAHSYYNKTRTSNISNNAKYISALEDGLLPEVVEELSLVQKTNEFILTRLRTKWGIPIAELDSKFKVSLDQNILKKYQQSQDIQIKEGVISLTPKGKLIADEISMDFFIEEDS